MQAEYPDQPLLKQIDTQRRPEPEPFDTETLKTRRGNGWQPQSEATGTFPVE